MLSIKEKKSLILRVVAVVLAALILLSIIRILIIYEELPNSNLVYLLFIKEIIFSMVSALFIAVLIYIIIKEDVQKINTKAVNYAFTDGLTGLYNRHYLNDFLQKFKILHKKDSVFAVAFIDIDKFKEINDTLGHITGDCILRCLALKLKSLTRATDILCRYGGEEFVIIYSDISKEDIEEKMQQIRVSVQNMSFKCDRTDITISIGLSFGKKGDDINKILQESDEALYMAKNAGRNCVKLFDKEEDEKGSL